MQQSHGLARLLAHAIIHHPPKTDPRCSAVSLRQLSYLFSNIITLTTFLYSFRLYLLYVLVRCYVLFFLLFGISHTKKNSNTVTLGRDRVTCRDDHYQLRTRGLTILTRIQSFQCPKYARTQDSRCSSNSKIGSWLLSQAYR